jgi:hypothetical protein
MIRKVLTLIAMLISSISFAHDANNPIDNEIMDKIEANKNRCVYGYSEDKIYLNPSRIRSLENFIVCGMEQ